jgi:hypothetical protein
VALGVLTSEHDGMSAELLPELVKKKAIELGLLTKDGKKKPKSEIPKGLLKKEDVYRLGAVPVKPAAEGEKAAPEEAPVEEPAAEVPAGAGEGAAP